MSGVFSILFRCCAHCFLETSPAGWAVLQAESYLPDSQACRALGIRSSAKVDQKGTIKKQQLLLLLLLSLSLWFLLFLLLLSLLLLLLLLLLGGGGGRDVVGGGSVQVRFCQTERFDTQCSTLCVLLIVFLFLCEFLYLLYLPFWFLFPCVPALRCLSIVNVVVVLRFDFMSSVFSDFGGSFGLSVSGFLSTVSAFILWSFVLLPVVLILVLSISSSFGLWRSASSSTVFVGPHRLSIVQA